MPYTPRMLNLLVHTITNTKRLTVLSAMGLMGAGYWAPVIASDDPLDRNLPHASTKATSQTDAHGHPVAKAPAHTAEKKPANPGTTKPKAADSHQHAAHGLTPEQAKVAAESALRKLREGNERYVTDNSAHPRQGRDRRQEVASGQKPFAIVVSCADSRVPPEILFDQGLGDLFVIRVAGQVADDATLGSIEYAVEHLDVPLIVVLGHERCGAVDAACKKAQADNHVRHLVEAIMPAVVAAQKQDGNLLANAVNANVDRVVDGLRSSWPTLATRVREGRLQVVGGVYDLDIGLVLFR